MHRPPLLQEKSLVLIFRGWVDLRAHGFVGRNHGKKFQVTPPGIDPGTVRLVVQRLNHYVTPVPYIYIYTHTHTRVQSSCFTPKQFHTLCYKAAFQNFLRPLIFRLTTIFLLALVSYNLLILLCLIKIPFLFTPFVLPTLSGTGDQNEG